MTLGIISNRSEGFCPLKPFLKEIISEEENEAQKLVREHIEKVKQDPNFRYHPL